MGLCPSRNSKNIATTFQKGEATEFEIKTTTSRVKNERQLRPDAATFVPLATDEDQLADNEEELQPWERFLEAKKVATDNRRGQLSRGKDGSYTAQYRTLLGSEGGQRKLPWQKRGESRGESRSNKPFDAVESWRAMKVAPAAAPAAKKKRQTPLKRAIMQSRSDQPSSELAALTQKFQDHLDAHVDKPDAAAVAAADARATKDDADAAARRAASRFVPFGQSERHYLSADEDCGKTQRHAEPSHVALREYVTEAPTPELEEAVTELLFNLKQLKVQEAGCGLESKRYAVGLREVARLLGSEPRALIVAPDVERNSGGMLEKKLAGMIETCKNNGVPVVFALSRRQLGKAVSKNVAISVMLVRDVRGAEASFNRMVEALSA